MSSLRENLQSLAVGFAVDLVRALQGASLAELQREVAGVAKRAPVAGEMRRSVDKPPDEGRLHRRSPEDIAAALDKVVGVLRGHRGGLRAEQIRRALRMQSKEMPRVLSEGIDQGKLRKEGQKRATTYFAA